jgi:hypothetical protein
MAEPDEEERGGDVLGDEQNDVDEAVPPLNLVVQHQEELSRDADGGEQDSEDTDGSDAALDGDDAAAGDALSGFGLAIADAAAALSEGLINSFLGGQESTEVRIIVSREEFVEINGIHGVHFVHEVVIRIIGVGAA